MHETQAAGPTGATADSSARGTQTAYVVGALVVALVVVVLGNTNVDAGEQGGLWPGITTGAICVVLAGVLLWAVRERWSGSARAALVLGIVALVTVIAFWSGVPVVLAGATFAVVPPGTAGAGRPVLVGRVLAGLAAAATIAATLFGAL